MKRILLGLITIVGAASAMYVGATGAFFSDTETSTGNTFAAGDIDLLIDNTSYYNGVFNEGTSWLSKDLVDEKFFNFLDLKPNDYGEDTISIHVDTNDAYMCAEVTLTSNDDNGINEPEGLVDQTDGAGNGELADNVNFIWWADDGDNVLEDDENVISQGPIGALTLNTPFPVTLADSETNIWNEGEAGGPIQGDETVYIGKAWCFGGIGAAPVAQDGSGDSMTPAGDNNNNQTAGEPEDGGITCDGINLGNETQTDSLTADISFSAVQSRNNPNFTCGEPPEEPPTFGQCTTGQQYADAAGTFSQGTRKDGGAVLANRSVPSAAFGAPQTAGNPSDVGFPVGSFVSLGFKLQGGPPHGSLVLDFSDNVVLDGAGVDLKVYETTGGAYPDEKIMVEISQDGVTWHTATSSATRDASIDIDGLPIEWARYVRITDVSNIALFPNDGDAYDLDAIEAVNCGVPEEGGPEPETATLTLVKVVVNDQTTEGDEQPATTWTLSADGPTDISGVTGSGDVTNKVVAPGVYNLSESALAGYSASAWVCTDGNQNDSDTVTLAAGDNATCTITNTEIAESAGTPSTLFFDNFGTGNTDDTFDEAPTWTEGGAGAAKRNSAGGGDESISDGDGGRKAAMVGPDGYICKSINAAGYTNLSLSYNWRGDSNAEAGDNGLVQYATGGTCAAPTGLTAVATHPLTTTTWQSNSVGLGVVANTTFLLFFRAASNAGDEDFRVDAVNLTGTN